MTTIHSPKHTHIHAEQYNHRSTTCTSQINVQQARICVLHVCIKVRHDRPYNKMNGVVNCWPCTNKCLFSQFLLHIQLQNCPPPSRTEVFLRVLSNKISAITG